MSLLGGCMPFELAVRTVERLLELELPAKTEQRVTQRIGQELEVQQQEVIRRAWEDYSLPAMEEAAPPTTLYVSTDGAQLHLQDQYHEAKVGAFYESELRSSVQGETKWHATDTTYVAAVDEPAEEFARRVLVEGYRRGWDQAERVVVLGDGAPWNWTHVSAQVPDGVQKIEVADFFHAQERLWDVGKAVFGEGTERTRQWAEAQGEVLLQGGVEQVIQSLESLWLQCGESRERLSTLGDEKAQDLPEPQKTPRENWIYFTRNRQRMRYDEYRRQGLFIGSGTVESACKRLVSARLKQSGMRWSKEGAHQVLQVRAAILSARDRWGQFWAHRHPAPRHHHRRAEAA